jgi:glycosyltransferase involved in cell wall biosynthesis
MCLSYVKALNTSVPWELVVVDNASTDATSEVLRGFARSVSFAVTAVIEPVLGLGRAHNRGWRVAGGEIVAFTDDDCCVLPDFLDEAIDVFADPKIGYCGGRIKVHDTSDHPITTNETSVAQLFPPSTYIAAGAIQGANMIFRARRLTAKILTHALGLLSQDGGVCTLRVPLCSMPTGVKPVM